MVLNALTGSAFAVAVALGTAMALVAQQPTFRTTGVVVPVFVTVTDSQQRLVTDLVEADFEVLDNDKTQTLSVFDNRYRPISIVVLLDTSLSMSGNLKLLRAAAEQFVIRLFPQDEARIGAFHDRIELSASFTNDRDALIGDLINLYFANPTRRYDALDFGLDALQEAKERKVILVLTDGDDYGSKRGSNDILDRARAEEVMVYVIGLESDFFNGRERIQTKP